MKLRQARQRNVWPVSNADDFKQASPLPAPDGDRVNAVVGSDRLCSTDACWSARSAARVGSRLLRQGNISHTL